MLEDLSTTFILKHITVHCLYIFQAVYTNIYTEETFAILLKHGDL
jgi:hypothetical protein